MAEQLKYNDYINKNKEEVKMKKFREYVNESSLSRIFNQTKKYDNDY